MCHTHPSPLSVHTIPRIPTLHGETPGAPIHVAGPVVVGERHWRKMALTQRIIAGVAHGNLALVAEGFAARVLRAAFPVFRTAEDAHCLPVHRNVH